MIPDRKEDLVVFLREHVDTANLSVLFDPGDPTTPGDNVGDIQFADYDSGLSFPAVYVHSEDVVTPGGGVTGYTGMDPGSGGPTSDKVSTIQADCWAGSEQTDRLRDAGVHPDTFATELSNEVWSACHDNANGPEGYSFISAPEPVEANDTDVSPTRHRYIVPVQMGYHVH